MEQSLEVVNHEEDEYIKVMSLRTLFWKLKMESNYSLYLGTNDYNDLSYDLGYAKYITTWIYVD